ncbi:hypothetical protein PISL3812_07629 [Talaromyces islandicus]|uniref:Uncharacterized protein n=1 Tax=Talaromyces islandicus TaxID=28573 RepID=A0A0U1M4W7_TALIS|nr:hypothetical protein PISL3812_07629 [Talaromyces islandicus]
MKLSLIISAAGLLATVTATAERGASERAMLWSGYLAEEIFTDEDKWSIAKSCSGTRQGLRGQANRCTLLEFLEHLWTPTKDSNGNIKDPDMPDRSKIDWRLEPDDPQTMDQKEISTVIRAISYKGEEERKPVYENGHIVMETVDGQQVPKTRPTGKFKKLKALPIGFTGWLNVHHLDGGDNWFESMERAGKAIAKAKVAIDSLDNEADKEKFRFYVKNAENAADRTLDLRYLDMGRQLLDKREGLPKKFGAPVLEKDPRPKGPYGTEYKWPDKDKTCKSDAAIQKHGSEGEARTAYDNAWNELQAADDDGQHQKAVDAIQACKNNMTPSTSCPAT